MSVLAVATATKDRSKIPAWHLVRPDDPGKTFCSRAVVALLGHTVSNLIGEGLLCRTCWHSAFVWALFNDQSLVLRAISHQGRG